MARVVFTPSGLDGDVPAGTSVLDAARRCGVDLDSVCGGRGICGRCQVELHPGSYAKWAIEVDDASLSPFTDTEQAYADRKGLKPDRRLGCSALVVGDVVVDVPAESQVHRPVVRKSLDLTDVVLDPAVHVAYLELPPSVLGDAASMSDLVLAELADRPHVAADRLTTTVLRDVHRAFAGQDRSATVRSAAVATGRRARWWRCGRASSSEWSVSPSTSAAPPSPATSATWHRARCCRRPGG
ncbi:MAG: 2Fe-2S iron-sulfur cluster-binding protein [Ilumatobacteraceae bacterium]